MMQRHMPIGYKMIDGKVQQDTPKSKIVKKIFKGYLSGTSTYGLAKELESNKFLNANNKPSWNHGSIGKILENVKYLGDELYPQIIDNALFDKVQDRRKEQCKTLGRTATPNSMLNQSTYTGRLYCGECGETFRKYVEHSGKPSEKSKWKCKKYIYKNKVYCRCGAITDIQIEKAFITAANQILRNRKILDYEKEKSPPLLSPEFRVLNKNITRLESAGLHSSKDMVALLFNRAKEVYKTATIDDYEHTTTKMKQTFSEIKQLKEYDDRLFEEVIKKVIIYADERIFFTFINNLTIDETY